MSADLSGWACVCGAGRDGRDIPAIRDEWRAHQGVCGARFGPADELPLAVLRPGWFDVADPRPCVICARPTVTRSRRRRPCHVGCADLWTAERAAPIPAQRPAPAVMPIESLPAAGGAR